MSKNDDDPKPRLQSMVFITTGRSIPPEVFFELSKDSDRAAAIVGSAIVEDQLGATLQAFLHEAESVSEKFLSGNGAGSTFSAKIDLGLLVGLYGEAAHREPNIVRKIRNKFAHSLDVKGFDDQQISAWAQNLALGAIHSADAGGMSKKPGKDIWFAVPGRDRAIATPRGRYLLSIQVLVHGFARHDARQMPRPKF